MAKTTRAGATPTLGGLPEDIVTWEILVRLPPKALLRCRAVCRAWGRVISAHDFLLAHHGRQPSLHILYGPGCGGVRHEDILAFDHQSVTAVQLHNVARHDKCFHLVASCDGLLVLSWYGRGRCFSVCCNPATRQHATLRIAWGLSIVGMYPHTSEYRLLLQQRHWDLAKVQTGFYVYVLGFDQPPRYIGWRETSAAYFSVLARVHDSLYWYQTESKMIIVFNTIAESFRQMRAPTIPSDQHNPHIFEADGTCGIYTHDRATEVVNIWALVNYEGEVWNLKYQIKLPVAEIKRHLSEGYDKHCYVNVALGDDRLFLLVSAGQSVLHMDSDGQLVDSFHRGIGRLHSDGFRLKQTLVPHTFFTAPEACDVNASPFM